MTDDAAPDRTQFLDWVAGWALWDHLAQASAVALGVGAALASYELGAEILYPPNEATRWKLTTAALVFVAVYFCTLVSARWRTDRRDATGRSVQPASLANDGAPHAAPMGRASSPMLSTLSSERTSSTREAQALIDASIGELERELLEDANSNPGWPHFLDDHGRQQAEPSLLSTSYAIRTLLARPSSDRYNLIARATETLLDAQLVGGGWAAGAQKDIARVEVTGPILIAASRVADPRDDRFQRALNCFQSIAADESSPSPLDLTFLNTVAITTLCAVDSQSPLLHRLTRRLLDGFVAHRTGIGGGWLPELDGTGPTTPPSVAHTARAVSALCLLKRLNLDTPRSRMILSEGIEFLLAPPSVDDYTETLRRQGDGREMEVLAHIHMTSSLALIALEHSQASVSVDQIASYYAATTSHCDHGRWTVDRRPATWAAYFGVTALDAVLKLNEREAS